MPPNLRVALVGEVPKLLAFETLLQNLIDPKRFMVCPGNLETDTQYSMHILIDAYCPVVGQSWRSATVRQSRPCSSDEKKPCSPLTSWVYVHRGRMRCACAPHASAIARPCGLCGLRLSQAMPRSGHRAVAAVA